MSSSPSLIDSNRAEASVVAICMSSPAHLAQISDELLPSSFANPALAAAYAACLTVSDQGVEPDMIAVSNQMRADGTLESIGGVGVIAEIACMFAPPSLWRSFVNEILEAAEVRQAVAAGAQLQAVKRRDDIDEALPAVDAIRRREVSDPPETARTAPPWDAFDRNFAMLAESIGHTMSLPDTGALVAAHAIFGGFMGRSVALELTRGWRVCPNIYTVCSGDTGSGKSATASPLMAIAMRIDAEVCAMTRAAKTRVTARVDALKGRLAKVQAEFAKDKATQDDVDKAAQEVAEAESVSLGLGSLVIQDATGQAASAVAFEGDGALMSLASEAREVLSVLNGKYTNGAKDAQLWLAGSSGDSIKVDRKGAPPITIHSPCFSSAWFVQPDVYEKIICDKELSDNGFTRRLLPCFITKRTDAPEKDPPPIDGQLLKHFEDQCRIGLLGREVGFDGRPLVEQRICRFDDAAREFFHDLRCEFRRDTSGDPWCESYVEFCGKWSLILHAAQHGPDVCDRYLVTLETLQRADHIMRWFRANRAHGAEQSPEINRLRTVAQKAVEGFAARDVYKCTPQLDATQAKALISRWISDGYVRTSQRVYRGKPVVTYHVTDAGWKLLNNTK